MSNLHRARAPISEAAWAQIEAEARPTFTRHVAGRRVVDVVGPGGAARRDAEDAGGGGAVNDRVVLRLHPRR